MMNEKMVFTRKTYYKFSDNDKAHPVNGWSRKLPAEVTQPYLWVKFIDSYSNGRKEKSYICQNISAGGCPRGPIGEPAPHI